MGGYFKMRDTHRLVRPPRVRFHLVRFRLVRRLRFHLVRRPRVRFRLARRLASCRHRND